MKSLKFCLYLSLIFLTQVSCSLSTDQEALVGQLQPNTRYYEIDGSAHALNEHLGQAVVLLFWDASCGHCKKILPEVNELAKSFSDGIDAEFITISINGQNEEQKVKTKLQELKIDSMRNAFSGNDIFDEAYQAFKGDRVPYILLLDRKGQIAWIGSEADTLKERLIEILALNSRSNH